MTISRPQGFGVRQLVIVVLMSAALWVALISITSAEVIRSFNTDIVVNEDSSLLVTETIVYDFEGAQRHGIYRDITNTHAQPASAWYKKRYIDLELLSVMRDGANEPYTIQDYDGLSVRIGDADTTISGPHTYVISYKVTGALASYDDGTTELYWNVTGDEWEVSMEAVRATVRAAAGVSLRSEQYCYVGSQGASDPCDQRALVDTGEAYFIETNLRSSEQLTIAQALTLSQAPVVLERSDTALLWLLGLVAWFSILGVWLHRWRTAYRSHRAVVAQYEPFEDFKPMFTGVLFDNRLDPRDLTASIVYLAQQGFITIKQTTDKVLWIFETTDYELTLLRPDSEAETELQKQVLEMLFQNAATPGKVVHLSDITKSQSRQRTNFKLLQRMKKAAVADLVARGFLEQRLKRVTKAFVVPVVWFVFVFVLSVFDVQGYDAALIILFIVSLVSLVIFVLFAAERRTARGYEALNYLKGFKDFLSTTEADRYKFHNAPDKNAKQFMQYLPYAIAFGVEKEWAEVFKDVAIDSPEWYSSPSGTYFNAAAFTTDIGSFATAFASSGASGSSGSSGGGFSGGGGGGGGGGSW